MSTPVADAVVVGAGPNGLAAAVTLARAGLRVTVIEANDEPGGGARTSELTLPGFRHDVCSAVHPMGFASPFFRTFNLRERVPFVVPDVSYAQPLDGGRAALAYRDLERTAAELGRDGAAWRQLFAPLARRHAELGDLISNSLVAPPAHPLLAARFGLRALEQGSPAWNLRWRGDEAPTLLAGAMAHAVLPLPSLGASATGLMLAAFAHGEGWPLPVGGSDAIIHALIADLRAHGGELVTGHRVRSLDDLPAARVLLFDTSTRDALRIAGSRLPWRQRRALRTFRYGNAVAKVDFALDAPVPWAHPEVGRAGVVHLGGTREQVAHAEALVARGEHPERPYAMAVQPTTFDPSRAPAGKHVLWTYAHVPAGSTRDMREAITRQIERVAPGFRDTILHATSATATHAEMANANYVGGDIGGGAGTFMQLVARPTLSPDPWRLGASGVYLCSSSAAPGPGVHGLSGWRAALSALRHQFGITKPPPLHD